MATISPPSVEAVSLVAAVINAENHDVHIAAIRSRDEAFAASPQSYSQLCHELLKILVYADISGGAESNNHLQIAMSQYFGDSSASLSPQAKWLHLGQMAGLMLKNALLRPPTANNNDAIRYAVLPDVAIPMKHGFLQALECQQAPLRNVASTLLATAVVTNRQPTFHISNWPDLIDCLLQRMSSARPLGAALTLQKIMQDNADALSLTDLDSAVPIWIQQLRASQESSTITTTVAAMDCLLHAIPLMPSALVAHWSEYLHALSNCTVTHPVWVCRSLGAVLQHRPERLDASILQFICTSTSQTENEALALEACDFWLTFATMEECNTMSPELYESIELLLADLIPVLLSKMVYTMEQRMEMEADEIQGDSTEEGKPVFRKKRGESTDDNEEDEDFDMEWNVRKCAAASLDALAHTYGGEHILPILLPHIESGLTKSTDPWTHEACLLALGAIAAGCKEEMDPHLGNILPSCIELLRQDNVIPQLQSIAAWTISQYSPWVSQRKEALAKATEVLLLRIRSPNSSSSVQVTCLSALGELVQTAGSSVGETVQQQIYPLLLETLDTFQHRKRVVLNVLDVFNSLAECCPGEGDPNLYVPALLKLWDHLASIDPADTTLLPLMESLATMAPALDEAFHPFGLETLDNAMCMVETVGMFLMEQQDLNDEDVDPIVCATDVVDGLVLCFREKFPLLVASSKRYDASFHHIVMELLDHPVPSARGAAFAVVGDICRYSPQMLQHSATALLKASIENMDPYHLPTATNAVWAVGELCVPLRDNPNLIEPFVPAIVQNLMGLLMGNGPHERGVAGLAENAAICMGRLALIKPEFCAVDAPRCLLGWCDALGKVTDPTERRDAFLGFVQTIYANPQAIPQASPNITETVVSIVFCLLTWHLKEEDVSNVQPTFWSRTDISFRPFPPNETELFEALTRLVRDLKVFAGEQNWHLVQKNLPVKVRQLFREVYQV